MLFFSKFRCYRKDAITILVLSRGSCQVFPEGVPDPAEFLPPTEHVEWKFRRAKTRAIGHQKSFGELLEVPEIAYERELSTRSTRLRARRLAEILNAEQSVLEGGNGGVCESKTRKGRDEAQRDRKTSLGDRESKDVSSTKRTSTFGGRGASFPNGNRKGLRLSRKHLEHSWSLRDHKGVARGL